VYIGHGRLCVCVSACPSPHYYTIVHGHPDVSWGNGRGALLADLQSVHGFRC